MKHKKLSVTYIIALSIIAVLVLIGTFVVHNGVSNLAEDATAINVAGRQRMLSQKMTKATLTMQQSTDVATFNASKKELREALDLFTKSHTAIQLGSEVIGLSEPTLSEQSKTLFKEINPTFEALKAAVGNITKLNFSDDADANSSAFQQSMPILLQNEGAFLKTMNAIVTQFETESGSRISTLNIIVYAVTGSILITLFLLAVLFFQPIVASIQKFITDIQTANDKLKETEAEILKSSEKALEANEKMFFAQKDLQKTQATLKQSETLFRGVVENAPLIIFSLDKQGQFLLSEGKGLEDIGLKSGQVVGMNAFDLYKDSAGVVADLEAVLNGGIPVESISQTNGEYFENKFTPLKDQFGNVTGMVGISANVTDRQKFQEQLQSAEEDTRKSLVLQQASNAKLLTAQEKIQESEDNMRKSLEKSLEATERAFILQKEVEVSSKKMKEAFVIAKSGSWEFEANLDGTEAVLIATDEYYALYGTNFETEGTYVMQFQDWMSRFVLAEDHASIVAALGGILQNPEHKANIEFRTITKTGESGYQFSGIQSKHFPKEGKVKGQGLASDITERKLGEIELAQTALKMKQAFLIAKSGSWEFEMKLDGSGGNLTLTDEYYALFGTTAEKEGGYTMTFENWVAKFVYPDDIHILTDSSVGALQNAEYKYLSEHRAVKADKTIFEYSTEVQTKLFPEEGVIRGQGIASDVTERKQAQKKIEEASKKMKEASLLAKMGSWELEANLDGSNAAFTYTDEYFALCGTTAAEYGSYNVTFENWLSDFTFEESHESLKAALGATLQNPVFAGEVEFVHRHQQTKERIYTIAKISSRHENGKLKVLGTAQDITERKLVQLEAEKREKRLTKQNDVISELSAINFSGMSLVRSYEYITRMAAIGLDTERVSIWDYKADKIISRKLYQKKENTFTAGTELFAKDFPIYFDELKTELIIAANDANTDLATSEFSEVYLKPLGIGAMLDIPIRMEGKMVGVLCNEHIGGVRVWESDEITFSKSIADIIALAFEASKRQTAQKDLEEYSKELKQMFGVVQENEVKLDNALRLAKIGEFEFDLQKKTMNWSSSYWETVLDTPKEDNITFEDFNKRFAHPDDVEKSNQQLEIVLQSTDPNLSITFEIRVIDKNGNIKTTEIKAKAPTRDENGVPISISGTSQDITERKVAEQIIEDQTQKMKQAFRIAKSGAWQLEANLDGSNAFMTLSDEYFAIMNTSFAEQGKYEFPFEEWMSKFILPEDHKIIMDCFGGILQNTEYTTSLEVRLKHPTLGFIVTNTVIETIHDTITGKVKGQGTAQDITERKAAAVEIEKTNKELVANEARLSGALKELRVVQNQIIASAKNDKVLALKRGVTEAEFEASLKVDQYKDIDFSYIDDLKSKNLPVADNEIERLKALYDYDLLDTEAEEDLDGLTKLAAFVCGTPISLISLIDKDRQWFKSDYGLGAEETARDIAFCHHAIMDTKVFEVEDAMADERFKNNPLVQGSPDIRFYAGAPLTTPDGFNIGTLCVIDKKTSKLSKEQTDALEVIAAEVMSRLESRRQNKVVLAINNKALAAFEELEKAQVEIDANERRFANIAANTPDLIYQFFVSAEGKASFPYASPAIETIFELKVEDVKDDATPLVALTAPEDMARFQQTVATSAETMQAFTYEGKFITPSGKTKFVRAQSKPEYDNGGIMWNGTMIDITELKDAEAKVNDALDMQKIINDSMIIAQRELAKKNDQLGKSEEEMRQIMERQLEANEQLMMAEKKIKKALNSELESKEELERTYGTLKDAQSQLVHSEKMASLGQLTAGIAHEINNPINFVYNGIDTLKMSLDELLEIVEKYAELDKAEDKEKVLREVQALKRQLSYGDLLGDINSLVGDIKKGAVRTMEIVKGLRVFSRLDEEEKKFANIGECLDATLTLLQNKFKGRVEVKKYYDDTMGEINCYPGQLNQVFMNIINNAIQAVPDDKKDGVITIYTETQEENVVIRIKDNGVGMSEQVKKRVFEPFFTTKAVGVGTGLGMSITFGIIEKHNGQIFVNSEEGKGTEFVIQIPKNLE